MAHLCRSCLLQLNLEGSYRKCQGGHQPRRKKTDKGASTSAVRVYTHSVFIRQREPHTAASLRSHVRRRNSLVRQGAVFPWVCLPRTAAAAVAAASAERRVPGARVSRLPSMFLFSWVKPVALLSLSLVLQPPLKLSAIFGIPPTLHFQPSHLRQTAVDMGSTPSAPTQQ